MNQDSSCIVSSKKDFQLYKVSKTFQPKLNIQAIYTLKNHQDLVGAHFGYLLKILLKIL